MAPRSRPVPAAHAEAVVTRIEAIKPSARSHDDALLLIGARASLRMRKSVRKYRARNDYDGVTQVKAWRTANPERAQALDDRHSMPQAIERTQARITRLIDEKRPSVQIERWRAKLALYQGRLTTAEAWRDR